jgi:hypothetical protein
MKNRRPRDSNLLADLFHEDWNGGRAVGFARNAAAHVRRRRRLQRALAAAALVFIAIALRFSFVHQESASSFGGVVADTNPSGYQVISTNQLLSQLHDRPFLVVERGIASKVVLLDEGKSAAENRLTP